MLAQARIETNAERRTEPRFALFLAAMAHNGPTASRVQLRNLSRSGALAEALRPPREGSTVTLARGELLVEADVIWVRGIRFGLRFRQPLRATELLVQLSLSREGR